MVVAQGNIILPENLPAEMFNPPDIDSSKFLKLSDLDNRQNQEKMKHILEVIEASGSKTEAARRLGVTPTHLQYLINQSKAAKARSETEIECTK